MTKPSAIHPYSDRASFDRIMLLISAIANNPGIAPSETGVSPMVPLLEGMKAIALNQDIPWQDWSEPTIRKDLALLRKYGILAQTTFRSGYFLGQPVSASSSVARKPRRSKSNLTPQEIVRLRDEGRSLLEISKLAGVSRERVRQIEEKERSR